MSDDTTDSTASRASNYTLHDLRLIRIGVCICLRFDLYASQHVASLDGRLAWLGLHDPSLCFLQSLELAQLHARTSSSVSAARTAAIVILVLFLHSSFRAALICRPFLHHFATLAVDMLVNVVAAKA